MLRQRRTTNTPTARRRKAFLQQLPILREVIDQKGRYDAGRLRELIGWSLAEMGRYLDRDATTILRSGSAKAHQNRLAALATLFREVLGLMNGDLPAAIAWFRTPIPVLNWSSPCELIFNGQFQKVRSLVDETRSGFAA